MAMFLHMPRLAAIRRLLARLLGALAHRLDPELDRLSEPPAYTEPGRDTDRLP